MPMVDELIKRKLTLSVDEKVIEKAKDLGINISEVTESVLRSFAFKPSEADKEEEYQKYIELFVAMKPLLQQYGAFVTIGAHQGEDVDLAPDGRLTMPIFEDDPFIEDIHSFELWELYNPRDILSNFVSALSDAKERRKEKLGELEMAKRIVEAISQSMKMEKSSKEKPA
jgi:hypothetical protein